MEFRRFLTELKRRRVYRVAVVYAAVAFVVWQAAEIAVPGLNLPNWVLTLVIVLTLLGFPIAVVLAWAFDITPAGIERTQGEGAAEAVERPSPPRLSVAVLPFENLSADPENEYFSDGISEELLNTLARVPGLRVAARTSSFAFKGKGTSICEIGGALNVANVVEGSVRRVGDRVRITAQLIGVADGYHLWSEGFDRELGDILMVQREIAESIGETLEAGLTRGWEKVLPARRRVDAAAFDHYLRGRFCLQRMTREDIDRALEHFQEAVSIDPDFAPSHAGVAWAYLFLADAYMPPLEAAPRAAEAAERAIELDPTLAEGHTTLGFVRSFYQWRWEEGRREIEQALEVNPNHAEAHFSYALYQAAMDDRIGALASMKRAFELDPLSAMFSFHLEWAYLWTGQPDAAIRQHETTEELAPGMVYQDSLLGTALSEQGRYEEAIEAFETAERTLGRPSHGKGVTLARMGRTDEALQLARNLEEAFEDTYVVPEFIAEVYGACGEKDRAFFWLERGLEAHSSGAPAVRLLKGLEVLQDDPQFQDILRRLALVNT
jgi:adenylate cyclase